MILTVKWWRVKTRDALVGKPRLGFCLFQPLIPRRARQIRLIQCNSQAGSGVNTFEKESFQLIDENQAREDSESFTTGRFHSRDIPQRIPTANP